MQRHLRPAFAAFLLSIVSIGTSAQQQPRKPVAISTPDAFKAALAAAQPGDVLTLASSFVYTEAVKVSVAVTIQGETLPEGRMDRAAALPSFRGGMEVPGDNVILRAIDVRHTNPLTDILRVTGKHVLVDRVRVLGDSVKGAKRCIAGNAVDIRVLKSYVGDCFGAYPGQDTQAFAAWDTPGPILLFDNYFSGGAETIMLGGSDPSSAANIPSDVQILNNYIGADPAWQSLPIGVKSRVEIKNARRVLIQGNTIEYCWGKHGQDGYLLTINVRNQEGRAPFSTIEDVLVYDNDFAHGAAAINILGSDNRAGFPSERMKRVSIIWNRFKDLDAVRYAGGSAKMIMLMGGASDLTIDDNKFEGTGLSSAVFIANGKYDNLHIRSNAFPKTTYEFFGNAIGADLTKITAAFITSGNLSNNVVR